MAEYMRRHLGETFDGIVSGATARGIFVQLVNSVEGFVGVEDFPDCEFQFDGLLTHTDVGAPQADGWRPYEGSGSGGGCGHRQNRFHPGRINSS